MRWVIQKNLFCKTDKAIDEKPGSRPNMDGFRGALWLPSYLRRDATALGCILLSI